MLEPEAADPSTLPPRRWATACGLLFTATGAAMLVAWVAGAERAAFALSAGFAAAGLLAAALLLRERRRSAEAGRAAREARQRLHAELRRAQEALAAAQAQQRAIFEASPVAAALTRDDGRVVDANAAFLALTGYARQELLSPGFRAAALCEDPQDRQRLLGAMRSRGVVRGLELRLRRRDGALRTVLASLESVDLGGAATLLGLFQDVTERQRLQEEREARIATEAELERLRRTDEFRVEFINSTAHELSTPLTPLMLSAVSLRRDLGDRDAAERHLGVIQRAVDRLARVVGDMVSAADLQARAIALKRQPLDLARQLQAAVDSQRPAAAAAGLTLEGPPDPRLTVDADGRRLRSVLGHLLGNAIKFTPPGGRVQVAARRDGDRARVEVRDTGVGLTARQVEGLWRPYAQAHDKTQRTDSGSGLGLYVTKGIVELHKGEVGVSSRGPGQGSTFWFTLPLAREAHREPVAAAEPVALDEGEEGQAIEVVEEE
jgi:PAS domain S-box-containing protein